MKCWWCTIACLQRDVNMSSLAYSQWVLVHYHSVEDRSSNNKVKEPQNTYMGRCLQLVLSSFPELQWNCGRDYWWKGHLILLRFFFSFLNCSVKMWSSVCCTKEAESLIPRPLGLHSRKSYSHVPCIPWVSIRLEACGLHGGPMNTLLKRMSSLGGLMP